MRYRRRRIVRQLLAPTENCGHMHIFHTMAHFCDCVCNLIIDRGAMYVVLKDAVECGQVDLARREAFMHVQNSMLNDAILL